MRVYIVRLVRSEWGIYTYEGEGERTGVFRVSCVVVCGGAFENSGHRFMIFLTLHHFFLTHHILEPKNKGKRHKTYDICLIDHAQEPSERKEGERGRGRERKERERETIDAEI